MVGVGILVFIETTMSLNILRDNLNESELKCPKAGKPQNTAIIVKERLLSNVPNQLHCPPQSSRLSPIENLWDEFNCKIRKRTKTKHTGSTKCFN